MRSRNVISAPTAFPPAAVHAPPPIPIATSEPANCDAVSFIDLPAEIRNAIYDFALVLPDPLMVASAHLHRIVGDNNLKLVAKKKPQPHSEYMFQYHSNRSRATDCRIEKGQLRKQPISNLNSVGLPSLGILLTCRQIYHEATSVFFSQNAFAITRARCSPWNGGQEHDVEGKLFTEGADWMLSLGSQLSKLKLITLDLNALCIMHGGNLELLPLLRVLWNRSWTGKLEFKNASALAVGPRRCGETGKNPGIGDNLDFVTIDGMIESLLRDDLNIREHVWSLGHVAFHCKRLQGVVLFRLNRKVSCRLGKTHKYNSRYSAHRSDGSCLEHCLNFSYKDGKCVRIPNHSPRLMDLAAHIRTQIFDYVFHSSDPIIFDLSSSSGSKLPGLLYTNTAIRTAGSKQYYRLNSTSLLVKNKVGQDHIVTLDKVIQWMFPPESSGFDEDLKDIRRESVESLVLEFEPSDHGPRQLEDLRINTADLWHKRVRLGNQPKRIQVEVRLWPRGKDNEALEETAFNLDQLLKIISRALHKLYDANMGFSRRSMLEIVVDGYGEPKAYVLPATMKMYPFP